MSCFFGDGYKSRFSNGCRKAEEEGKNQQPEETPLAGECLCHAFANRKQSHFKTLNKHGQSEDHHNGADYHLSQLRQGLADDEQLEKTDNQDYGQKVGE